MHYFVDMALDKPKLIIYTNRLTFGQGVKLLVHIESFKYKLCFYTYCKMPRISKIDIHDYEKRFDSAKKNLAKASISETNRNLILKFDRVCSLEGLTTPRRIKIMETLKNLAAKYVMKDFDMVTKDEIKNAVLKLDDKKDYSPWTKQSYKAIMKKFYKWLVFGDNYKDRVDYPEVISWLRVNIKQKDKPRVQASDILSEGEIKRLIQVAEHPRDKAFISMLYELGARIGEIGSLRIKDITRDKYSFIIDLTGKTGHRTPRIIISDPYLTNWINIHQFKDDPNAPLWILTRTGKEMKYGALRALVLRLKEKACIKKRVYPHLFRHSRATHLLINRQINETQAKVYFGWVPSSRMLSDYSHLLSKDVNDAILELNGIKQTEVVDDVLKPRQCIRCSTINPKDALFCYKCSNILDVKTAIKLDEERRKMDDVMNAIVKDKDGLRMLAKMIIERGF